MGSDALAPAFVHNVFNPLEIGGAQRKCRRPHYR